MKKRRPLVEGRPPKRRNDRVNFARGIAGLRSLFSITKSPRIFLPRLPGRFGATVRSKLVETAQPPGPITAPETRNQLTRENSRQQTS